VLFIPSLIMPDDEPPQSSGDSAGDSFGGGDLALEPEPDAELDPDPDPGAALASYAAPPEAAVPTQRRPDSPY